MKLSERALLVSLHIGVWGASKHDKEVSDEVSENHRAEANAGRYSKSLVARKDLKEIATVARVARQTHFALTLPWEDNGARIITNRAYEDYALTMRQFGSKYNGAAKRFLKDYSKFQQEAQLRLGTMFNAEDYPDVSTLRSKFYLDVEPRALQEAGDFRAKVSDETAKAIAEDIERRTQERLNKAVSDLWSRVTKVTENVVERLKAYDKADYFNKRQGSFRDSLIDNIKEIAELLPALNINDDPRLNEIQKRLLDDLCSVNPADLREDDKLRKLTRKKATDILKRVNEFIA